MEDKIKAAYSPKCVLCGRAVREIVFFSRVDTNRRPAFLTVGYKISN
jgi:hypothetical protein